MIRFLDFFLSLLGIIFLIPFFIVFAIWIVLDSKGTIFYKQIRVGKNGIDFVLYKFRTMSVGSDQIGLLTIGKKDPRITRSGYYFRKYKLDELPQLINVLKGDMSLVGPRPEVRKYVMLYTKEQLEVLKIRPGITDLASIQYSNENEILKKYIDPEQAYIEIIMHDKIRLNMDYIKNYSTLVYLKIIFLTIRCILFRKKL